MKVRLEVISLWSQARNEESMSKREIKFGIKLHKTKPEKNRWPPATSTSSNAKEWSDLIQNSGSEWTKTSLWSRNWARHKLLSKDVQAHFQIELWGKAIPNSFKTQWISKGFRSLVTFLKTIDLDKLLSWEKRQALTQLL